MQKKYIINLLIPAIVIIILLVLYNLFAFSTISSSARLTMINEKIIGKNYELKLRPGIYNVKLYDPLKEMSEQIVTVGLFQNIKLSNPNPELSVAQILEKSGQTIPGGMKAGTSKFFTDNTWLVLSVVSTNPRRDGYTVIFKYENYKWTVYSAGTGLDDDQLRDDNIEVYNYVSY